MPKPSKNHLSDVQFYTRFDVHAYGLNVFRAELFFLIDILKFTSQTVEEHDLICDKACARAIRRMEYAIDSGFEEVEDKHADRLDAVKHLVNVQCFTVGHNFYKLLANHTRETLGEDMKPYLFCKQFSLPCEGNEKIKNRENRQEVLSEVFQTSTRGMIERFEKNRMYEDCVLADVHASAIDEFLVKLEDDMEEDMEREMNSVQLEAYCCYNYHEAYNSMIEEIDRMFAELKADSAETRHWVLSSKEMVIKRCRVEATEFFNRYHDYWNDLLAAEKENREIDTFDIDPRLKIMLRESRKRINKSKTERAGLELAENLKRNFNCENPKDFWNTSSQKKFNNLAYLPEVEGTIAKEVQNQYGKHVQEKMYAVSSDVQNLNVEAPKKKNEQSRKEVKASVQSSLQGSSTQSTSGPQRIAEEVQNQYENQVQGKMNAVSSDVQNLNVEAPKKKNEQSRKEVKASVQSSLQGSSTQSTSGPQRIAEEVQNQYENQVQGKMNAVSSDVQNLNVEAPKKKNEQSRKEVKASVQSSLQGSSTQSTSGPQRIAEEVQIQYENQVQGKMNAVSSDVQNLNVEAPKKKNEQSRKEVKASVQSSLQGSSTQSTSGPQRIAEEVQNQYENQVQGKMNAVSSDVQNLNVEAPKKKNEQFRDEVKAPVQSSQQGSSTQNTSRAERAQRLKTSRLQRAQRSRNYTYLQNLQRQRTEENAAAQSARTSNQNAQVPTQNRESVRPPSHPEHRTDILAKMIAKCSISK